MIKKTREIITGNDEKYLIYRMKVFSSRGRRKMSIIHKKNKEKPWKNTIDSPGKIRYHKFMKKRKRFGFAKKKDRKQ